MAICTNFSYCLLFAGQTLFQLMRSGWWRLWIVEIVYFDVRLIAGEYLPAVFLPFSRHL